MDPGHWARRLSTLAEEASVPGAVLGVWAEGRQTVTPYGVLSTRTGVETTADSVFQIGSITKTWIATMIAQLVQEDRASYDATVADLLPGVRLCRDDIAGRVTLEHLLTHTSGMDGDVFDDTGRGDDCVEKYVALLADAGHDFEPGDATSYCNSGFVVLGRVLEVLDGRTWDESLRARLVEPLGLSDTVTLSDEAILRRAAVGHRGPRDAGTPYDTWAIPRSAGPAGGITATAADLLTYARQHFEDDAALMQMRQSRRTMPPGSPFSAVGLAWRLARWSGTEVIGHDGGTIGQHAALRVLPERGIALCVLTNGDNGGTLNDRVLAEVLGEVAGVEMPSPPAPDQDAAPTGLARHEGTYRRRGIACDVAVADEEMTIDFRPDFGLGGVDDEPETITMLPADASGDRFVGRSDPSEEWFPVTFGTLPDGRAQVTFSGRVTPRV
jgi:CubicO group peptidase (beta-lactamase class C family)